MKVSCLRLSNTDSFGIFHEYLLLDIGNALFDELVSFASWLAKLQVLLVIFQSLVIEPFHFR